MSRTLSTLSAALLVALTVWAQQGGSVKIEPSIAIAEAEYRQAQEDWLRDDTAGIAAELLTGNPQVIHQRIRHAKELRDTLMAKKETYLDLVSKRFADTRALLTNLSGPQVPVSDLRRDLDNQQSAILADQERVEALIRNLPPGDEYSLVRRDLEGEVAQLKDVQNAIAMRTRSLEKLDQAQQAANEIEKAADLDQKLDAIQKIWDGERVRTRTQRAMWARLYDSMDREVDRGKAPAQTGKQTALVTPPLSAPAAKGRTFTGTWNYKSQPNAWTGFAEPEHVLITLSESNGRISGVYDARLPGPRDLRDVKLRLTGVVESPGVARLSWVSDAPPATGEMILRLGSGDGRLLVERTVSSDAYVPRGSEVLLPR